ncbi:hypothetical protein ACLOJK_017171 [Asimina triloba]
MSKKGCGDGAKMGGRENCRKLPFQQERRTEKETDLSTKFKKAVEKHASILLVCLLPSVSDESVPETSVDLGTMQEYEGRTSGGRENGIIGEGRGEK